MAADYVDASSQTRRSNKTRMFVQWYRMFWNRQHEHLRGVICAKEEYMHGGEW